MAKNIKWFKKIRGSYLPSSWQGNLLYLIYLAYAVAVPLVWYSNGHTLWQLLINVLPAMVGSAVLMQYIASRNS
jgi:hypothetical protein